MYKLDKYDIEIVNLLMEDGRMSAADIARHLGDISERSVRYRIERMVKEGIIRVSAIVNPKVLGYNVVADVFVEVESGYIMDVARKLSEFDCVSYVACSIGETDVSVQIVARNNEDIYNFVTEVIGRIPGVRKTTTSIVPFIVKDVYQWRIPLSAQVEKMQKETAAM